MRSRYNQNIIQTTTSTTDDHRRQVGEREGSRAAVGPGGTEGSTLAYVCLFTSANSRSLFRVRDDRRSRYRELRAIPRGCSILREAIVGSRMWPGSRRAIKFRNCRRYTIETLQAGCVVKIFYSNLRYVVVPLGNTDTCVYLITYTFVYVQFLFLSYSNVVTKIQRALL